MNANPPDGSPSRWVATRRAGYLLVVALVLGYAPAARAQGDGVGPAEVKAAYLVNFLRYSEWPRSSFDGADDAFRVVVAGNDEVAAALEEIAQRSARIGGRRLEVERLSLRAVRERDLERMLRAHALYLEEEDPERTAAILGALAGSSVLTVGGTPGFAALGGMIGLRPEGRRIVFDANPASIRASQVTISARVLQLARIVEGDGSR